MVYDRQQVAALRWRVLGISLAAWAVMLAVPAWSDDVLPASLCSSAGATAGITATSATGDGIGTTSTSIGSTRVGTTGIGITGIGTTGIGITLTGRTGTGITGITGIGRTGTGTGTGTAITGGIGIGTGTGTGTGIGIGSMGTTTDWLTADWLVSAGLGWMLMIVAMMLPMSIPALTHIRLSTFAHVRWRAMALFLAGYGAVWLLAGWVMKAIDMLLRNAATDLHLSAVAAAAVLALVWQVSPAKQRCLNRCHEHRPLAAFGWHAAYDALALGLRHAAWCVGSCWALMLLVLLLPQGHVAGMVAAAVLMYSERLDPPRPPAWRLRGLKSLSLWLRREWAWRKQGAPMA